ncbi:2-phospho-L-lactate transferase [Intrasporangium oryzae NRRL B-24470]|uniref:2-phospho-L-lactate transferase n=1 Tax=Intrasporangium oryzae NRRL B-24470 TaxID=1386089 RepID=W9G5A0_9MICO|nr:2-phospho-L-lactate transferase [Intrasporangium oryzae]EWT00482.1 2-phospho-L-lactate transferase [Intrasporangium oryzae NRRL B-24470]
MRITALAGGVGGARFLRGLLRHLSRTTSPEHLEHEPVELTVIGNTGDDITLFGLRVCPDIDTLLYTLGGGIHEGQGWGRADETHHLAEELAALGATPQWFTLGDKDFATHVFRSQLLGQGMPLSAVVERLSARWGLGEQGVTLLPMTDTPVETHVVVADGDGSRAIHFQEWWVRHRAELPAERFVVAGLDRAAPAPGVLEAIRGADVVLLPPSNPVVSIGIILGVPGIRDALRGTRAPVVGVSPLVGGRPVRGHADVCLRTIGVAETSEAVAGLYADFLDGWLVDEDDPMRPRSGLEVVHRPLLMSSGEAAADLAGAALDTALRLRAGRTIA